MTIYVPILSVFLDKERTDFLEKYGLKIQHFTAWMAVCFCIPLFMRERFICVPVKMKTFPRFCQIPCGKYLRIHTSENSDHIL